MPSYSMIVKAPPISAFPYILVKQKRDFRQLRLKFLSVLPDN